MRTKTCSAGWAITEYVMNRFACLDVRFGKEYVVRLDWRIGKIAERGRLSILDQSVADFGGDLEGETDRSQRSNDGPISVRRCAREEVTAFDCTDTAVEFHPLSGQLLELG